MFELSHHKNNTEIFAMRVLSKETTPGHRRFLSQSQFEQQPAREEYYSWALNWNFFLMIFWFVRWKLSSCRFLLPLHFHGTREKDEESQDSQVRYTGCKPSFAPGNAMVMMVGMVLITLTRIDIDIDKQLDNMKRSAVWVISSVAPRQGVRLWPSAPSTEVWPQPCRPQPSRDDIDQDDNIP